MQLLGGISDVIVNQRPTLSPVWVLDAKVQEQAARASGRKHSGVVLLLLRALGLDMAVRGGDLKGAQGPFWGGLP